ncbi:PTS mannitol-specific transporter subunit IIBC [Enterococcus italicus]|uniref:PTS mannitol-specific transporter subunit IIBC n=1 Tax=Enterococcus italicus TaxID=246144 RepID=UPI0028AD427D|nr:PTS mannitol-specific transporter subunit IIBC [Enterococcus italicus]
MANSAQVEKKKGVKAGAQKLGSYLSSMVMPNIGAFIAWGVMTALFIGDGWLPNERLATMVSPTLTYLLPLLIAYTGGQMVYGQRGAVVGAISAMGVIMGTDIPMFIGAMIMGPLGGWCIKKFDDVFKEKVRAGFEMLVNNFSAGLIGFGLAILAFYGIGPVVEMISHLLSKGVEVIVGANLLPLANVFIEPGKVLFLNNAINHGILTPLGTEQAATSGKSILFLLEANPGPGLGILLAFTFFGKGSAKSSAPGAIIIQFLGGIHEIYFPYIMMKPALFLAAICGGISGTFMFQLLGAGLKAASSPGSIFAILLMTPKGLSNYVAVLSGVIVGAVVSFIVASMILRMDKSQDDTFDQSKEMVQQQKAESKGQVTTTPTTSFNDIDKIIFACDAGMGSSAMGASILRDKVKKAGIDLPVSNSAINNLQNDPKALVVTQEELQERAKRKSPSSEFVAVENFMNSPRYDEIVQRLLAEDVEPAPVATPATSVTPQATVTDDYSKVTHIIFACDAGMGSSAMGASILRKLVKNNGLTIPVTNSAIGNLQDEADALIVSQKELTTRAMQKTPSAIHVSVDNFLTAPEYDKVVATLKEAKKV